ncbi:hypothetical protein BH09BAC5_BH09BAC5_20260 [soil metagenome]
MIGISLELLLGIVAGFAVIIGIIAVIIYKHNSKD